MTVLSLSFHKLYLIISTLGFSFDNNLLMNTRLPGQINASNAVENFITNKITIIANRGILPTKINSECKLSSLCIFTSHFE